MRRIARQRCQGGKKLASIKGSSEPTPDQLVGELAEQFLEAKQGKLGDDTYPVYARAINGFCRDFGRVRFDALKGEHIERWAEENNDWSEAYRKGILIKLRTMFNWARKTGRTHKTPMAEVVIGKMPRREFPWTQPCR